MKAFFIRNLEEFALLYAVLMILVFSFLELGNRELPMVVAMFFMTLAALAWVFVSRITSPLSISL